VLEFPFFRDVAGVPPEALIAAHDLRAGGFFGLIVAATPLAPAGAALLLRRS
jgi:hypothetical protein